MKIALVFPPFYLESMYSLPPLGLVNLATALKGLPHKVVLMDFVLAIRKKSLKMGKHIYEDCVERILGESPHVVGLSAQCTTFPGLIQIAKKIRDKAPDVKIVMGGHNAGFVDCLSLKRYPFIDAIVRGEGERTFPELVAAYESGKDGEGIQGVTYRRGPDVIRNGDRDLITNLDDLPLPDYHFLPSFAEYRDACQLPRSIAILEVGRGCPHRCIYCSESLMWRRRSRNFSVPRLVKEMANLHENFGAECFLLAYDQFTARRGFVEEFCRKVIHEGLNRLPWYCISRLDSLDAELLALMREAGCESMCFGVDSGSKRTLSFIRKGIDQGILYDRIKETSDQGIIPTLSFVIGFPEEQKQDIDETLGLALRAGIVGNNNPLIQMPTVLPGTDLHLRYQDRLVRRVDTYFALGIEFDQGRRLRSDEDLIDSDAAIFSSFYNLPCPARSLEELDLIALYFPQMVRLYPKSFLLLSLELEESLSDLFIRFLRWLEGLLERKGPSLTPEDCYRHFRGFVFEVLIRGGRMIRRHFPDILKYENLSLEVGKFGPERSPFHIDLQRMGELRPVRREEIIIEKFDFNMPVIILDLKAGHFNGVYPKEETLLIFRQEENLLDVLEINPFTKDFLDLCNGDLTLQIISDRLYDRYGEGKKKGAFFDSCVEAAKILGEEGFLVSRKSEAPLERR